MKERGIITADRQKGHTAPKAVDDDDEIDLMELLRALWRGKWLIGIVAFAALVAGAYYAYVVAEPEYRSSAKLTLERRTNQVVDIENVMSGVSTDTTALNTELEIILSRRVLSKVVDELELIDDPEFNGALRPSSRLDSVKDAVRGFLGIGRTEENASLSPQHLTSPARREATIGALRNALSASIQRNTYVFNISATTVAPEKSARIVNTLASIYINEQVAVKFEATEQAVAWLSDRVTELERELKEQEDELKRERADTDLISREALEGLNLQAKELRDRLEEIRARADVAAQDLIALRELRDSEDRAALVGLADDPALRRLLASLRGGDAEAAELFAQRVEALIANARGEQDRLRGQAAAVADSYRDLQNRIDSQSSDLVRIEQMSREVEATRTLYETFLTRLKETTIQRGLQQADSRVLSDATAGAQVAPRSSRIVVLSVLFGAMIGSSIVLVRQFLHKTFRTAEELEAATGLPVLGQIPKMPIKVRNDLVGYLQDKPTSASAEAIRNLRTSLLLSNIDAPPKVIMSTSALPGEGKTTQAVALTQNLAGLRKKVLLIEGDIRRRALSEYIGVAPDGGIVTALSGETPLDEVVLHDHQLEADVLMGEKTRVNAADLFSSTRFSDFVAQAREAYDFVIIDTPPILVVPDSRVIGQHVDAILVNVAWDKTHGSQLAAALREMEAVNAPIAGLALARIDPKGMRRYGYGGEYAAYYSAYGKDYYEAG